MDNHKKLADELLKADGIDPHGVTKPERMAFAKILNEQLTSKSSRPDCRSATKKLIRLSNITKMAAAVIFIVVLLGLHQFRNALAGTGVVWADVPKRFEKIRSYKAQSRRILTEVGQQEPFHQGDILRYFSPDYGSLEETYVDGELVMQIYCSIPEKSALIILPLDKVYYRFDLNEELLSLVEYLNPANMDGIMNYFGSERCIPLGDREIDGITAKGFEIKDVELFSQLPKYLLEPQDINIRLWINEERSLPVEIEGEGFVSKGLMTGFKDITYKEVMHDIEYDVEIDKSIFEPNIPENYRLIDPVDIAEKAEFIMLGFIPLGAIIAAYKHHKQKKENRKQQIVTDPGIWRLIMKSNITKFAAAAVIIIGVFIGINMLNGTPAYAIEQTIEAGQDMHYLHFYFHASPGSSVPDKEAWLEYDDSGQLINSRVNWYNPVGSDMAAVWKEGRTQYWTKESNTLKFFEDEIFTKKCVGFSNRNDPTRVVETMYELEKKGDVTIEIQESSDKTEPIILTCTWKPNTFIIEGTSPQMREIVSIDPVTKLVTSIEVYKYQDGEYTYCGVWTYPDYDTLFEPGIFDLEQEVPADVNRLDLMTLDIGLEQTDLTDKEIAVKVMRSFLEALIAKDYDRAIKIYGYDDPDEKRELRKRFENLNIVRVISIDNPIPLRMDSGGRLKVPCKIELEENGKIIERQIDEVYAERVTGHPNRWRLDGDLEK